MKFLARVSFLLLLSAVVATQVAAEEKDSKKQVFELGEVVVMGQSDTINEVGTVDTVDADMIQLTNSRNLSEALNTLPGISVSPGGPKAENPISIRGFEKRYVPILYDGIPLYIPYDGYVDAGNLTTDNISQVSVSKGVSSVLYGFNTMGGVINVVSRKPKEEIEGSYRLEATSHSSFNENFTLGSNQDKYYFLVGIGMTDSNGWHVSDDFVANANEDGGKRDDSDLEEWNASLKLGFTPIEGHEYAIGYQTIDKDKGLPSSADPDARARYWRFTDWEKQTFYLIGNTKVTNDFSLKTRLYRDEYYNVLDSYDDNTYTTQTRRYAFHSTYDDHSYGGSVVGRATFIPNNVLSGSFHYKKDVHTEQGNIGDVWGEYEQTMYSFGLEDDILISDNLSVVVGVGYDTQKPEKSFDGTDYGYIRDSASALNPQIGVVWTMMEDLKLHASVARKTRWPTLNELYSDGLDNDFKPNPDLNEEKSTNYEIGFEKPLPNFNFISMALFYSDLEDKIEKADIVDPVYAEQYQNIDESRLKGLEIQFRSQALKNNTFEANYTYVDAENTTPGAASTHLNNIPEHKLFLSDLYAFNKWVSAFASAEYNSERYGDDANYNQVRISDFWVANFKLIGTINKSFNIEAGVKNIFDKDYEMEIGYPQPGREFFIGVNGTF